jgi:hypothetical protein
VEIRAKRRGKKIATIAIARKLLTRACHLLAEAQSAGTPSTTKPPASAAAWPPGCCPDREDRQTPGTLAHAA